MGTQDHSLLYGWDSANALDIEQVERHHHLVWRPA